MKLWIISDIHLEFGQPFFHSPPEDVDVLVCAGDVGTKGIDPSIQWLADACARTLPVIFVPGNHEFYSASVEESIRDARKFAAGFSNIHFLENDAVEIGGVRFIGGTLWTDFRLFGGKPEVCMSYAQHGMNDFKKIKFSKTPYCRSSQSMRTGSTSRPGTTSQLNCVDVQDGRRLWSHITRRLLARLRPSFGTTHSPLVMLRIWKT